jgi:hypothetical protein
VHPPAAEENIRLLMMAKQPGLDRQGIRLREVPLDLGMANVFADTRRRIAYERLLLDLIEATRPCSSAVTRSRRSGTGSIASGRPGPEMGMRPKPYAPEPGGPRRRLRLPNATARAGMSEIVWAPHADAGDRRPPRGVITRPGASRLAVPGGSTPIPILRCSGGATLAGRARR